MTLLTTAAATGAAIALAAALEQLDLASRRQGRAAVPMVVALELGRSASGPVGPRHHAVIAIVAACVALLVTGPALAVLVGGVVASAFIARTRRAARARARACEAAAPSLGRVLADALRGGASIRTALVSAGDDHSIPDALRHTLAFEGHALSAGRPLRQSLEVLASSGGDGLRLLCGTVALHAESGGRLSTELERLAVAADAARRVEQDRVAATAQARATVRVVGVLPLLALAGAQLASPSFLGKIASHPIALGLLLLGLLLEAVAFVAARAIVGPSR